MGRLFILELQTVLILPFFTANIFLDGAVLEMLTRFTQQI